MEDTSKIMKKVVKPAATQKGAAEKAVKDDGMVAVEYTKASAKYPGTARMPLGAALALEKCGKVKIIKNK